MRLATWAVCAFCYKLRRRAAASLSAIARRLDAARRAHVLRLRGSLPRALAGFDVFVSAKGTLLFWNARGVTSARHLATAHDELLPVGCILNANGTVGEPLSPPPGSAYELAPHASSCALVYYDSDRGLTQWEPPPCSTPLRARPLGEPSAGDAFSGPPPRFSQGTGLEAQSLRWTGGPPLPYRDRVRARRPVGVAAHKGIVRLLRQPLHAGFYVSAAADC